MKKAIIIKLKEALLSVLPAAVVILIAAFILKVPFYNNGQNGDIVTFLISALLLIIGLTLFTLGSQNSILKMASKMGNTITKKGSLIFLIVIGLIIGFLITISEPSLWVLSDQFPAVPTILLLLVVGLGVAIFLVIALLRIVFQINLKTIIFISYGLIFLFVIITPIIKPEFSSFIPFAFDSSGVTTGPMAVPFIMSLGLGISRSRSDKNAEEDSFGLVGVASIGPIIAVLFLGIIYKATTSESEYLNLFGYLLKYFKEMLIAVLPFALFFLIFQFTSFKLNKKQVIKVLVGFLYTYLGLVIFLTGANAGFVAMGDLIGSKIAVFNKWLLIPVSFIFGFVLVFAEPSVVVLNEQVSSVTSGAISKKIMSIFMSIGMAIALLMSLVRVVTGISILWFLIPGYLAVIILSFFSPKLFTAIAFDSGGAVSGAMTSTFTVALALGATKSLGGNILTDAFGLVAFVAMMPLITIQILGIVYKKKNRKVIKNDSKDEVIELKV